MNIDDYLLEARRIAATRLDPGRVAEQLAANRRAALMWLTSFVVANIMHNLDNHDPGDEDRGER